MFRSLLHKSGVSITYIFTHSLSVRQKRLWRIFWLGYAKLGIEHASADFSHNLCRVNVRFHGVHDCGRVGKYPDTHFQTFLFIIFLFTSILNTCLYNEAKFWYLIENFIFISKKGIWNSVLTELLNLYYIDFVQFVETKVWRNRLR